MVLPTSRNNPHLITHEGREWLYVLSGTLRLLLDDHAYILGPGEAAEFDTMRPHWFGSTGAAPVEIISLLSPSGERIHTHRLAGEVDP